MSFSYVKRPRLGCLIGSCFFDPRHEIGVANTDESRCSDYALLSPIDGCVDHSLTASTTLPLVSPLWRRVNASVVCSRGKVLSISTLSSP